MIIHDENKSAIQQNIARLFSWEENVVIVLGHRGDREQMVQGRGGRQGR